MKTISKILASLAGAFLVAGGVLAPVARAQDAKLLNVSYDPTRELYDEINKAFAARYKSETGKAVSIDQSHGGSGKQARSVVDGLKADVVTLALGGDITPIEKAGLIAPGWEKELPSNSAPYTSTIVFLVRKGNPKQIKDWDDLVKPGIAVITPNPRTSGGARWNFLAAWAYAAGVKGYDLSTEAGVKASEDATKAAQDAKAWPVLNDAKGQAFVAALYKNVPVLDTGARGSTVTFAQKSVGDVLIAWENEAWLAQEEFGQGKFEIVYPSVSILAEPQVAIVDKVVDAKGTRSVAEAYLKFLYTPEAQDIIGELHYRPRSLEALKKHQASLPPLKLFTIDEQFGGWGVAQKHYFGDGGVFDQLYKK
ncbi:MAG TPA: sulfate ABC transporter substrate-binding protein [Tepidisphaeraceae bacterium]|nr:sulfate ABC transporter substrate-binding protein [Tepidisphaeraceae bacterium]